MVGAAAVLAMVLVLVDGSVQTTAAAECIAIEVAMDEQCEMSGSRDREGAGNLYRTGRWVGGVVERGGAAQRPKKGVDRISNGASATFPE